jgi:hypothetical protein
MTDEFVAYVGDASIHDGVVRSLFADEQTVVVIVGNSDGNDVTVTFAGITGVEAIDPVGMVLYALVEMVANDPQRRFVFQPSDEESNAKLEVTARIFTSEVS